MTPLRKDAGRWGATADWIISALEGDTAALAIFTLLSARYADRDGNGWYPTVTRIAEDLRMSDRTVKYATRHLRQIGVLRTHRTRGGGAGVSPFRMELDDTHPERRWGNLDTVQGGDGATSTPCPPRDTSYRDPEIRDPEGGTSLRDEPAATGLQGSMFAGSDQVAFQTYADLFAGAFRGRKGSKSHREKLRRLVRAGATRQQVENAITVARSAPRDDDFRYALAVLERWVEEGKDGTADVERVARSGPRDAQGGHRAGQAARRGMAGDAQGPGATGEAPDYSDAF